MSFANRTNVETIRSVFYPERARTAESRLLRMLNREYVRQAEYLLRDHRVLTVMNYETSERDKIDYLLSYYSILYIALSAEVVDPSNVPKDLARASRLLQFEPLRRYYSEFYPLPVVLEFSEVLRADSLRLARDSEHGDARAYFFKFFLLAQTMEFDRDIEAFLWMLDGGKRYGWNFDKTWQLLSHPSRAADLLLKAPGSQPALILNGCVKFAEICIELEGLLQQMEEMPKLQNLMLSYYGYWLQAKPHGKTGSLIDQMLSIVNLLREDRKNETEAVENALQSLQRRIDSRNQSDYARRE